MQPGKRELGLGLDAHGACDAAPGRLFGQELQQSGLADAGLATEYQHCALPLADALQQAGQSRKLIAAAAEHRR